MKKHIFYMILSIIFIAIIVNGCPKNEKIAESPKATTMEYGFLNISVKDNGENVPARFYIEGSDGKKYFAEECVPYEKGFFGKRIGYSGKHFTSLVNPAVLWLPAGTAKINIQRGKEYIPIEDTVTVVPGKITNKEYEIKRWINMNEKGWYSGDLHVHRPLEVMGLLMRTEDLNVAVPQTVWDLKSESCLDKWLKKADNSGVIYVDDTHVFSVLGHELERFENGALLIHHTGKNILPVKEWDEKNLTNISFIEQSRKFGSYVETEKPWWPESHIDVALGKVDFTEIINNHYTVESYLPEHDRKRTEFKKDYPDGVIGYCDYVCDLYYAFLNCGFKIMPSAGSASGVLPNPLGYNRIYVKVDGKFSYDNWFKAMKQGRSFVTNGPMLIMTANGNDMGSTLKEKGETTVKVNCSIYSMKPIGKLEIIKDGEIVKTFSDVNLSENSASLDCDVDFASGGWIAARCFEKRDDNVVFAHTSPIFVEIAGKPFIPKKYAAEYFLEKTKEVIYKTAKTDLPDENTRKQAMDTYSKALKIFEDIAAKSQ